LVRLSGILSDYGISRRCSSGEIDEFQQIDSIAGSTGIDYDFAVKVKLGIRNDGPDDIKSVLVHITLWDNVKRGSGKATLVLLEGE
jgi:hypothetical protein